MRESYRRPPAGARQARRPPRLAAGTGSAPRPRDRPTDPDHRRALFHRDLQRRLIDFSSGLAYAVGGTMRKVDDQVFLLTPTSVEVSEEDKERLQARGLYRA